MAPTPPARRMTVAARSFGYLVAVLVNAVVLYGVNVWPGWEAVPFLTGDMGLVVGLVNASIVASLAANAVYVVADPRWLKALGGILTTGVGLAATVRMWQVFPFDFSGSSFDWALVARILLALGIAGALIGIVAGFVSLLRALLTRSD